VRTAIEILRRLARQTRDWRVRILVPVIVINLLAFAGLYALMDRYAMTNLINTHKFGAMMMLDQIQLDLHNFDVTHNRQNLQRVLAQQAGARGLLAINIYNAAGVPLASSRGMPAAGEIAQARVVMLRPEHPTVWLTEENATTNLFGVRALPNDAECASCHVTSGATLGAIQLGMEMTATMAEAKKRVRRNFVMAGAAWLLLLALMFWTGGYAIGRPLAAMEKSIKAVGLHGESAKRHDLDALARRIQSSLWDLIGAQRQREEDITRHMARAEQLAALGQLAAGLTHEIKNPLAGVSAALELLRDDGDPTDPNHEVYDQMLSELRRVSGTVDALLRLAKPQPPQRADVDLGRVTREVTSLFAARLRRQGVHLLLDIPEDLPTLALDSGLMVQLLMNLLANAMQATERGGTVRVLVAPFPQQDGVVMAVSDTGRGIAPEHLERIFDPFFTTKEEGTGLGLPICKQIVEQHGGTMRIESEPGEGTRVMVLLPDLNASTEIENDVAVALG